MQTKSNVERHLHLRSSDSRNVHDEQPAEECRRPGRIISYYVGYIKGFGHKFAQYTYSAAYE